MTPPADTQHPCILVVDDNKDVADMVALLLEDAGFHVTTAYGGEHALRLAEQIRPSAVILDLDMPSMGGLELSRRLRNAPWGSNLRLVVMSGWTRPEDIEAASAAGCDVYLMKPASLRSVLDAVMGNAAFH